MMRRSVRWQEGGKGFSGKKKGSRWNSVWRGGRENHLGRLGAMYRDGMQDASDCNAVLLPGTSPAWDVML